MRIVGTAGHVDHGKSALIEALTGTHPDRLIEEQARGMTLDLGFAHLRFDDGIEAGIVDVPGHERFLHNMLAGAAGMDLLLLVVDAGEGAMPQTFEHLAILRFLNIRCVIVVVSKIDLLEPNVRADAVGHIGAQLKGTLAEDAPTYTVSATTGENLEALRAALHDELAALPPRDFEAPAYLPIDRVFVLPGLGTVVTGTLMQGRITAGETLAVEPGGEEAHVRTIGVFGSLQESVEAGSRVALNLPALDHRRLVRGQAIVGRELSARRNFAVSFEPVIEATTLLRKRTPVRAYIGSAETLGTLVVDESAGWARLDLREPVVAFTGLRFVLRRPSPKTLLGGGCVKGLEQSAESEGVTPSEAAVRSALREQAKDALDAQTIASRANVRLDVTSHTLDRLVESGDVVRIARPTAYLDGDAARAILTRAIAELEEAHRSEPWALGSTSIALARALDIPESTLVRVLAVFVDDGRLINREGYYATLEHRAALTLEQRGLFDRLVPISTESPLLPVPFTGVAAMLKRSGVEGAPRAFDTLLASGALVKVGDELYRGSQIEQIRARVESYLRAHERMTAAEFRDLLGTSRKYAVPLLEWLDAHGVTLRSGDYRLLRKKGVS